MRTLLYGLGALSAIPLIGIGVAVFLLTVVMPNEDWLAPLLYQATFYGLGLWCLVLLVGMVRDWK